MIKTNILYSSSDIDTRVQEVANEIADECYSAHANEVVLICVLKGAAMFCSDLSKALSNRCGGGVMVDYIQIHSYENDTSSHEVTLVHDVSMNLENKFVVIVEDIVDTGQSLQWLIDHIQSFNPSCVKVATLIDKTSRREISNLHIDYVGFHLESDIFVLGYGMDYNEYHRAYPCIFEVKEIVDDDRTDCSRSDGIVS